LNALDAAQTQLIHKLALRDQELGILHRKEQERAAQTALEGERERLMRDLHDGISGHLVSIIAQSEQSSVDGPAVNQAARAALEDLRAVIQSLDLEDGDLLVALAGFRERMQP